MSDKAKFSLTKTLVALLFFISGFSGLIYQVLWVRQFKLLLGSSIVSVSIVLAVFMGGLLLGAWWIGKKIAQNKIRNELKTYGLLELFIGVFGLLLILLLPESKYLFALFNEPSQDFSYIKLLLNILITGVLLILPTAAMGATLPLLVNYFTSKGLFRSTISVFYSINALGGAIASLAAGFYLIKEFGINGAIYFAVVFNILVGVFAMLIARNNSIEHKEVDSSVEEKPVKETGFTKLLLLISFFTGFLALAYEVLWVRCLNYIINNSTYTFAIILFVFLFGIALGSYVVSFINTIKHKKILLGVVQVVLAVCGLLIISLFYSFAYTDQFSEWFIERTADSSSWQKDTGLNVTLSIIVFLFPAVLMGLSFPLLSDLYFQVKKNKSGVAISRIYVFNTLGSILGALIPIFILIPLLGSIKNTLIVLAILNFIIGFYFIYKSNYSKKWIVAILFIGLFAFSFKVLPKDKVLASLELVNEETKDIKPLYYNEGVMATVKVYNKYNKYKSLSIDGITIASESFVLKEKMIAHLPFFTDRNIENALAVGLASGSTAKSILKHKEVKNLDIVEIVPSVMNTLKYFNGPGSIDLQHSKKANIYIDDIVSYLIYCDKQYDLISSDGKFGFLNRANTTMLSQEYYQLCKDKLTDKGVFVQWISTQVPNQHLETILSTIGSVFPFSDLFLVRQNLFVISSKQPIAIKHSEIMKGFSDDKIKADLINSNIYLPEDLLSCYVGPNPFETEKVNTMNKPILEYNYNEHRLIDIEYFETSPYRNLVALYQKFTTNKEDIESGKNTLTSNNQISHKLNKAFIKSRINYYNAHFSNDKGNKDDAIKYYKRVAKINHPYNDNDVGVSAKNVGEYYFFKKQYNEAIKYFNVTISKLAGYPDAYTFRGASYFYLSDTTASIKDFNRALELNPNDASAAAFLDEIKRKK